MNNEYFIDLISNDDCLTGLAPTRVKRVLDTMKLVDRREFIPDFYDEYGFIRKATQKELSELGKKVLETNLRLSKANGDNKDTNQMWDEYFEAVNKFMGNAIGVMMDSKIGTISSKSFAYNDFPVPIGYEQTCSQPSLVAQMATILRLAKGKKVLEIGAGCGYSAAIASHVIGEKGLLITMEIVPELANLAELNLRNHFGESYDSRLEVICEDGSQGLPERAPFDRIYLTAGGSENFDPEILENQLNKHNGVLLYPPESGRMHGIFYRGGKRNTKTFQNVGFVPLKGINS